ncbi:MAG: ATP-binding protein, partial [Verrucomicrobia bacterium]|nr:ATP-binding protein [Verrucomicrobiota bacterium]
MKPAAEWDERHILGIPSGELDWVEFKSSRALDVTVPGVKESEVRNELSKQLSAFSNSSGGTLVYGISDPVPGQPLKVDSGGVSLRCKGKSTKEWLEDVIPNLVKRYYARIGGKSVPIGHRFVTDIIGRAQYPKLEAVFGLSKAEETEELLLHVYVRNVGRIFANYVNGEILIPLGLFPAEQEADHEIVSKEGWRYYRIYFDNVHKDVVGVSGNAHYARAYTVGRYDPVLPSQGFSVNTGVKMTELKRHDFLGKDL